MEDYLVRVYRRDASNPFIMFGIVEKVGHAGEGRSFSTLDELLDILADVEDGGHRHRA